MAAAAPLASAPPGIELASLTKRFGARRALDALDLHVEGPQLLGVVGPDGAGKTTLLRSLAGLLEVEAERAFVLGFDLRRDVRGLKARVGYVPQVFALNPDLSVIENLGFTARLHRLPDPVFTARAAELLELTALAPFRDRPAAALSGGMKQKLAVANALLPEPALLLLDECTAGVDVLARAEIFEVLEARRRSTLIVASTSYLDEAERCDRLLYLDAGRLRADGTPREIRERAGVELYRAWGPRPRAIARAAARLPFVSGARSGGRFARVEVAAARSPGRAAVLRALAELPDAAVRVVETAPVDMEAALSVLARGGDAP